MQGILDKVYGSIIGGAIGDALGAPNEGWNWKDIRREKGRVETFLDYNAGYARGAGHVTDDSYLRHLLCMAIVKKDGRITPDDFGALLIEKMNPGRLWINESLMQIKLKQGMNPWWETGRGNINAGSATMMIAPAGIINAGDPDQAYQDAFCLASINQDGNNRDFAACYAAGVAEAFSPGATVDSIIRTMFDHSDYLSRRALTISMDLAGKSSGMEDYLEKFYTSPLIDWSWPQADWKPDTLRYWSGNSIDFVPALPAILHLCKGDPNLCIIEGANFGRDCDTISSCIGTIVGALHGAPSLRPAWIEECEAANTDIFQELHGDPACNFRSMAEHLTAALRNQKALIEKRLGKLREIL